MPVSINSPSIENCQKNENIRKVIRLLNSLVKMPNFYKLLRRVFFAFSLLKFSDHIKFSIKKLKILGFTKEKKAYTVLICQLSFSKLTSSSTSTTSTTSSTTTTCCTLRGRIRRTCSSPRMRRPRHQDI